MPLCLQPQLQRQPLQLDQLLSYCSWCLQLQLQPQQRLLVPPEFLKQLQEKQLPQHQQLRRQQLPARQSSFQFCSGSAGGCSGCILVASEETRQGPAQDPRPGTRVHSQADEPVNGDAKDLHRIQGKTQESKGL